MGRKLGLILFFFFFFFFSSLTQTKTNRQGPFGATFSKTTIYSARPGLRLWSADFDGTVLATLNFKGFFAPAPSFVVKVESNWSKMTPAFPEDSQFKDPALNFTILLRPLSDQTPLLLSWQDNALYLIDLEEVCVPKWLNQYTVIKDVAVCGSEVYILHGEAKKFTCLSLHSRADIFEQAISQKSWDLAYTIAAEHQTYLLDNFLSVKQLFDHFSGDCKALPLSFFSSFLSHLPLLSHSSQSRGPKTPL